MERSTAQLDHYYIFGDVYETLDTCDQLNSMLARLRRQDLLTEDEHSQTKQSLAAIRSRVEDRLNRASLMPRGPSLP